MAPQKPFYITTPIYYVNDVPHIGHAYTTVACDVLARFMRLDGRDVKFLTGTDEHGQKVEKSAAAKGDDPQVFVDRVSQNFRDLTELMNISNDDFIRTTDGRHREAAQGLWNAIAANGDDIYLGSYAGWYSVRDEAFWGEDELKDGPGGKKIAPSGAEAEWVEESTYFFRLSAWGDRLLEFYESNPDFILPDSRRNEVLSFVKGGLRDLSISRTSFRWGIPVPDAPDHIMYVWIDALTNYMTAAGYPDTESEDYKRYWPADVHMVGKDILRFHTVYWPAFLMAAGLEPPRRVFAHGWWTVEGEKMSKSSGNAIDPAALIEKFGLDPLRYFLMREVPFGNDGNFSQEAFINRANGDLANDLGNLAQRVLGMIQKYCEGAVPNPGDPTEDDQALLGAASAMLGLARTAMDRQQIHLAIGHIWKVIGAANRYVDAQAPWKLRKTNPARNATVLYVLAEVIRHVGIMVQPLVPDTAARLLDQLVVPTDARGFDQLGQGGALVSGTVLPTPQPLFPRIEAEPERP